MQCVLVLECIKSLTDEHTFLSVFIFLFFARMFLLFTVIGKMDSGTQTYEKVTPLLVQIINCTGEEQRFLTYFTHTDA